MIVLFDVLGTLFSLEKVRERFKGKDISPRLVDLWFAEILQAAMASTLASKYVQFKVLAHAALKHIYAIEKIDDRSFDSIFGSLRGIIAVIGFYQCQRS